jgi:hypothetical protein
VKLFKYLHPDRIDVLKNTAIRFSPPMAFNDPFEFKPVISGVASGEYFNTFIEENLDSVVESMLSELPSELKKSIPRSTMLELAKAFFEKNPNLLSNMMDRVKPQFSTILSEKSNELIGVLSLTEKPDNLLMWSHYSESHRGYCIGFDSNHSFFNRKRSEKDEFYYLRKVKYLDHRPSKLMVDMNGTDMFLLKSDIWEYEQEWRMCAVLPDADTILKVGDSKIHLFNFPTDAIKEIIIGVNAENSLIQSILSLVNNNPLLSHVKIKQAVVSEKEYALSFNDL